MSTDKEYINVDNYKQQHKYEQDYDDYDSSNSIQNIELDESYIEEKYYELTYECVAESLFFIKDYTKDTGIPIAEELSFSELFDYFFD